VRLHRCIPALLMFYSGLFVDVTVLVIVGTSEKMVSLVYVNQVLDILSDSRDLRRTFVGIVKQTGCAAGGAAIGGALAGPAGAFVGTVMGGLYGYMQADDYKNLVYAVRDLSDVEKTRLQANIQQLVGAVSIAEFVRWMQTEGHRQLLLCLLQEAVKAV